MSERGGGDDSPPGARGLGRRRVKSMRKTEGGLGRAGTWLTWKIILAARRGSRSGKSPWRAGCPGPLGGREFFTAGRAVPGNPGSIISSLPRPGSDGSRFIVARSLPSLDACVPNES
jgi:hypothetical protein